MNKSTNWLTFIAAVVLLTSCNQTNESTTPTTETSPSPTAETAPSPTTTETAPSPQASGEGELIPVATYEAIDANKTGRIAKVVFITYYVEKAEPKLSKEDAETKFKGLDKDSDENLTKEEATGQK